MATRRILAAMDLSEPASEALRQGSEWARLRRAELAVCHVVPSLVGSHMLFPQMIEQASMQQSALEARISDAIRDRAAAVTGRDPHDFEVVIAGGTPYGEIMRTAEAMDAELTVVGSHARSGLESIFLGDVAERVVRHAHASVLVARPSPRSGRIVVATDLSDASAVALRAAAEQSRLTGAGIMLMYSIHKEIETALAMSSFGSGYEFMQHERDELRKKAERQLLAVLDRAGVAGEPVVTEHDPSDELVQLATERQAELVVVGATGRTALRRMALGKVAERAARHVPCSVLVARAFERRQPG